MNFHELKGRRIMAIKGLEKNTDDYRFLLDDGSVLRFHHLQDCCESVNVEAIVGTTTGIIGKLITLAEEDNPMSHQEIGDKSDSGRTITVYNIRVEDGQGLEIVWVGESNGFYSETVDVDFEPPKENFGREAYDRWRASQNAEGPFGGILPTWEDLIRENNRQSELRAWVLVGSLIHRERFLNQKGGCK